MARKSSILTHRSVRIPGIIVLVAALILLVLELTNTTHLFHTAKATSGTIPTFAASTTKSSSASRSPASNTANSANGSAKTNSTGASAPSTSSSQAPASPFGSFVSNHHPNLSGSPAPSSEQSVCNTTPGAACYIEFTQAGVVKKLASQAADSSGVVSWSWDIKQAGFTEGSWKVTAVASLNNQTITANDSLDLVVGP